MGFTYTIRPRDNLSRLAKRFGLPHWKSIYEHPRNAAFRQSRPNPNVIHPGDRVFIPVDNVTESPGEAAAPEREISEAELVLRPEVFQWSLTGLRPPTLSPIHLPPPTGRRNPLVYAPPIGAPAPPTRSGAARGLTQSLTIEPLGGALAIFDLNPVEPLPLEARIYGRFRERGILLSDRQLLSLRDGYRQGIGQAANFFRIVPGLSPRDRLKLADFVGGFLFDEALTSHLRREAPTMLEQFDEDGRRMQQLFDMWHGRTETGGGFLGGVLGNFTFGLKYELRFH